MGITDKRKRNNYHRHHRYCLPGPHLNPEAYRRRVGTDGALAQRRGCDMGGDDQAGLRLAACRVGQRRAPTRLAALPLAKPRRLGGVTGDWYRQSDETADKGSAMTTTTTTTRLAEIADHIEKYGHTPGAFFRPAADGSVSEDAPACVLGGCYLTHHQRKTTRSRMAQIRLLEAMWRCDWRNGDETVRRLGEIAASHWAPRDAMTARTAVSNWSDSFEVVKP